MRLDKERCVVRAISTLNDLCCVFLVGTAEATALRASICDAESTCA